MKSVVALPPDTTELGLIKVLAGFWWTRLIGTPSVLATVCTTLVLMPWKKEGRPSIW